MMKQSQDFRISFYFLYTSFLCGSMFWKYNKVAKCPKALIQNNKMFKMFKSQIEFRNQSAKCLYVAICISCSTKIRRRIWNWGDQGMSYFQKQPPVFYKKCPEGFAKSIGKHLCEIFIFNQVVGSVCLLRKRHWLMCFPVNFTKFLRNLYTEYLRATLFFCKYFFITNVYGYVI